MNKMIYLDYAATTKTLPQVVEAMEPYYREYYGNASTIYEFGEKSRQAVEGARQIIADSLNAAPEEIYFTSGGTESDNWALKEAAEYAFRVKKIKTPHIITTPIEHHAVLRSCEELAERGCQISYLPVDENGMAKAEALEQMIQPSTCLISIMFANNEIGTIQPIQKACVIAKKHGIFFHTDAVQAYAHVPICPKSMGIDLLSASAHKFGGPKGTGFFYMKKGIPLFPYMHGGAQERNMRAGTENVPGIVGMGKAAELSIKTLEKEARRQQVLRDYFMQRILREIPYSRVNGHRRMRLANNVNCCFQFMEGEGAAILLDMRGICVSAASACSTGSKEPSHVLSAIGLPEEVARGSLRFSFGPDTTKEELDETMEALKEVVGTMREKSPEYKALLDGYQRRR